jgi:hypothetical protein
MHQKVCPERQLSCKRLLPFNQMSGRLHAGALCAPAVVAGIDLGFTVGLAEHSLNEEQRNSDPASNGRDEHQP